MSKESDGVDLAMGCLIWLVALPFSVVIWGYVTLKVWNWWLPTAFSLPVITFKQAIAFNTARHALL